MTPRIRTRRQNPEKNPARTSKPCPWTISLSGGVASCRDFLIKGSPITITGGGTASLATETIDAEATVTLAGIPEMPLSITGNLFSPKITYKLLGAVTRHTVERCVRRHRSGGRRAERALQAVHEVNPGKARTPTTRLFSSMKTARRRLFSLPSREPPKTAEFKRHALFRSPRAAAAKRKKNTPPRFSIIGKNGSGACRRPESAPEARRPARQKLLPELQNCRSAPDTPPASKLRVAQARAPRSHRAPQSDERC